MYSVYSDSHPAADCYDDGGSAIQRVARPDGVSVLSCSDSDVNQLRCRHLRLASSRSRLHCRVCSEFVCVAWCIVHSYVPLGVCALCSSQCSGLCCWDVLQCINLSRWMHSGFVCIMHSYAPLGVCTV